MTLEQRPHQLTSKFNTLCRTLLLSGALLQSSFAGITANIGYINIDSLPNTSGVPSDLRYSALRTTATSLGAAGGLAWQSERINASLEKQAIQLDKIYNFRRIILPHHVLPPVIIESNDELNLATDQSIRADSKTFKIIKPARFATTDPTWRNYLYMNYKKPDAPNQSLLPSTRNEARMWNTFVDEGWKEGVFQANEIFKENLSQLRQDFTGMNLFRILQKQNMVNAPFVAETKLGVTGNTHELRINDRVIRITDPSKLQTDSKKWIPIFTDDGRRSHFMK